MSLGRFQKPSGCFEGINFSADGLNSLGIHIAMAASSFLTSAHQRQDQREWVLWVRCRLRWLHAYLNSEILEANQCTSGYLRVPSRAISGNYGFTCALAKSASRGYHIKRVRVHLSFLSWSHPLEPTPHCVPHPQPTLGFTSHSASIATHLLHIHFHDASKHGLHLQ